MLRFTIVTEKTSKAECISSMKNDPGSEKRRNYVAIKLQCFQIKRACVERKISTQPLVQDLFFYSLFLDCIVFATLLLLLGLLLQHWRDIEQDMWSKTHKHWYRRHGKFKSAFILFLVTRGGQRDKMQTLTYYSVDIENILVNSDLFTQPRQRCISFHSFSFISTISSGKYLAL